MASLYGFYIKEREGFEILEDDYGFATYKIEGNTVYIRDIYVVPPCRNSHYGENMANQIGLIAKTEGCTKMLGTVAPQAKGSAQSMLILLAYGMKPTHSDANLVYFMKEL